MAIQHRNIPDAELHEPKGAVSATANTAYFANGSGSGTWKKVGSDTMQGLAGDGGASDRRILTTGDNGFKLVMDHAYGNMSVNNNAVPFPVTAAADPTLNTASQYVLLTGPGAPFVSSLTSNISFDTNRLMVDQPGIYELSFWANIASFPSNTAKVGIKFRINGTTFSTRRIVAKSNSNGDYGVLVGFDIVQLADNDYVQFYTASDVTGNILFENMNFTLNMIRAL